MTNEQRKALKAFARLEKSAHKFIEDMKKFQKTFDPTTVGISEWEDDIYDTLNEIVADINAVD